ncbi:MAG: glycosyltransferase [Fibrobacter sp.]|nr:glycosyltransferase [Fibrobacter sp.]
METPLVSVLVASYQHASFVEAAIRSVLVQESVNYELLVIDDGSTDGSVKIIEKLALENGFFFLSRENRGLISTLNELAGKAKGKYICTLASDDVMPSGRLAKQTAYMENHPEVPACFGQVRILDAAGNLSPDLDKRYIRAIPQVTFKELLLGEKELHGCTELIRRSVFSEVGGFSTQFQIEDYPLWLALAYHFGSLPVLELVCCHYRIHGSNMHQRIDFMYDQCLKVIASYKDDPSYPEAERRWKANWFSALAFADKKDALRRLPDLFSFSWAFLRRLPKLLIPARFLRY